jgi:hypothetical protein
MKCDTRLLEALDVSSIENVETVKLSSKLTASDSMRASNFAVLLVNVPTPEGNTQFFRATKNSQVPLNTEIIRNSEGQLVGIPAVSGG